MKRVDLSFPEFLFIVGTRAALGAGLGLLAAGKLTRRTRHCVGATLVVLGAVTTIPAAITVFGKSLTAGAGKTAASA